MNDKKMTDYTEEELAAVPENLLSNMMKYQDTEYPVYLEIIKKDDGSILFYSEGQEFAIEDIDPELSPEKYNEDDDFQQEVYLYGYNNFPLIEFCNDYISKADDKNAAAIQLLNAQYIILSHAIADCDEIEIWTSTLYSLTKQQRYICDEVGGPLTREIYNSRKWLFDEIGDVESNWEEMGLSVVKYFI
jgi:hypothetical protein